jgi:hypothetical protein
MRANSITNLGVSIERDITSNFDLVQAGCDYNTASKRSTE